MSIFDQVDDLESNSCAVLVKIEQQCNFGNLFKYVDSQFIGFLFEKKWYLFLEMEKEVWLAPDKAKITMHESITDLQYSRNLANLIIEEIKVGRVKPFSIEG